MFQYPHIHLNVFAKSPVLNTVKTRLQVTYPPEFSLALHCALVNHCLHQWQQASICPLNLWLAGDVGSFHQRLPNWASLPIHSQHGEDLGGRLLSAATNSLEDAGTQAVLLVGTDCPFIDAAYLQAACAALHNHDVVIGPADDGGYVLLGVKHAEPRLFSDIDWGSERVYEQTLAAIKLLNLSYSILPVLSDVDRPEDIEKLKPLGAFDHLLEMQWGS